MSVTKYDCIESCNKCAGLNAVFEVSSENGFTSEAKTKCESCGFEDYWGYGFFESGAEIESKSDQYWFGNGQIITGARQ